MTSETGRVRVMDCVVCGAKAPAEALEHATVRSNVRKFREEKFRVWRCPSCRSIHAAERVDLAHYYAGYPIFSADLNWMLNIVYGSLLKRLTRAGLTKGARVLDYGCGSGALVKYLQANGYEAKGWDAFAEAYRDPAALESVYDCVVSQDVLEHAEDPNDHLRRLDALLAPGGVVSVGTPDAEALDLSNADDYIHTLHLPFHRHILAAPALRKAGEALGWVVDRYYPTMYNNTLFPTMNPRFVLQYVRAHDDCFDLVTEPIKLGSFRIWSPATPFYALFGYFFDRHTDIQFVFKKPL